MFFLRNKIKAILPAILIASSVACFAESKISETGDSSHIHLSPAYLPDLDMPDLDEVVITATRTPKALKDVPVVTRVISGSDIKKTDASNIMDLLAEEIPGLEFGFAMTQETSLNMNGFGGNAILFLVDGERLAGETLDNIDYSRLNLDNIARVEIVKGAYSALYGANAVGGVINLISKESLSPWHVDINTRYRNAGNEWRSGANININRNKWNSSSNLQYSKVDRIKLTDVFDTQSLIREIYGGKNLNIKERLQFRINDNIRLTARGGYFYRESIRTGYDYHYKDYTAGLRAEANISPVQFLEASYSYDQYDKSRFTDGKRNHSHDYSNRQNILHTLYTYYWGKNALSIGADYMHDYLTSYQFTDNSSHSQNSADFFAQYDWSPLSWLNLVGSVRYDYFSASSHGAITSRLASMFKIPWITLRASYAGGFRAPSLKELYMDFDMAGIQMVYGNPALKPEKSHNFNLSLEKSGISAGNMLKGSYNFTATGFFNIYDRRITSTDFPGSDDKEPGQIYCNERGVKVYGADITLRYRTSMGLGTMASYNYQHMSGRKIDSQFSQPRPHSATWRIDYDHNFSSSYRLYASVSGKYLSKPISDFPTDGAYSLWKFSLQQTFLGVIDLNFAIDNLFAYRPKIYYWNSCPTTGRSFSIGISLQLDRF